MSVSGIKGLPAVLLLVFASKIFPFAMMRLRISSSTSQYSE